MMEGERRAAPEQPKSVTIELPTYAEQDAMFQALYGHLMSSTQAELRGASQQIVEENQILRPIIRTLAKNLGRGLEANEWLLLGIVDDVTCNRSNNGQCQQIDQEICICLPITL